MDILEGLNPAQRQAVETIEGPLLIVAGPGSGKTRVIAHRVAYLVKVVGVNPRRIMAVTFTNKAAREMSDRLARLLGQTSEALTLGTFHAICARILRQEGNAMGLPRDFVIYDEDDQLNLVKQSLAELGLDPKSYAPRAIHNAISAAKARLLFPGDFARTVQSFFQQVVARVYERYQELLASARALDFDDLLMQAVRLLRSSPEVKAKYQGRYLHILIDEFQDTNVAQYVLARELAERHRNLCVVGDPDQSIYSWRFADLSNILNFEQDYPEAKVVLLEQSYRSTKTILQAAEHVISVNQQRKDKNLWTENEVGPPVAIMEAYTEEDEAHYVIREVESLRGQGYGLRDCAVLYRTNAQSRPLEEACLRYGLPYKLVGATRFYERREVKDLLAYLRLLRNPEDSVSLARIINVPPRGIGQRTREELERFALTRGLSPGTALEFIAQEKEGVHPFPNRSLQALLACQRLLQGLRARSQELDVVALLDAILEALDYQRYLREAFPDGEERWENVLELRTVAQEYQHLPPEEGLASFLEGVTLVADVDRLDGGVEGITLITLHQAKGLEFPVVFIVGLEEGILPHVRSFGDPDQMEEERRLCYVGITRAKERLYLLRARRRHFLGASTPNPPSRFLRDIPSPLTATSSLEVPAAVPPLPRLAHTFQVGERIRHTRFGEGVVVSSQSLKDDQEITVSFQGEAGVRKLLVSFAPLERAPG